jgi:hypothetical protein
MIFPDAYCQSVYDYPVLTFISCQIPPGAGLSDYLLLAVLSLLWSEVSHPLAGFTSTVHTV